MNFLFQVWTWYLCLYFPFFLGIQNKFYLASLISNLPQIFTTRKRLFLSFTWPMALRGWQEALIHTSSSLCSQTWIIPSFSNWIDISCVGEFPSFVPLSGQWFMMIVGKQWRHKKTSRPLGKLHDWAPKDKTNVARCSSEHSDERVGVSSSTLIAHMILYCSYGSQLRHARINLGFLVSTSVMRLFELYKNHQFRLCFTMFWKKIPENSWSSMVMDL